MENTVLITSGNSGIGLALAARYLQDGNTVIICGRNEEKLNNTAKEITGLKTMLVFPDLCFISAVGISISIASPVIPQGIPFFFFCNKKSPVSRIVLIRNTGLIAECLIVCLRL